MAQPRVLVVHASRTGSTAEMALWIGRELVERGALVDVATVGQVEDLERYDAVVLGSAIRYDRWLPEMVAFVRDHAPTLRRVPVAGFFTCLVLAKGTLDAAQRAARYGEQLDEVLLPPGASEVRGFAGQLELTRLRWPLRWVLRMLSAVSGVAPGDHRDRAAVSSWAREIFVELLPTPATTHSRPVGESDLLRGTTRRAGGSQHGHHADRSVPSLVRVRRSSA